MPDDPITPDGAESFGQKLRKFVDGIKDIFAYVADDEEQRGVAKRIAPSQVTDLHVTQLSPTHVSLAWIAPVTGTEPIGYTCFFKQRSAMYWAVGATTTKTSAEITGLAPGTIYEFEILAHNG